MPRTSAKVSYEPVLKLPPLPEVQYSALKANIAVNGVLVPILVNGDGPRRKIIDGNYRKRIADELDYTCPEIVQGGLTEEEQRTLARALNLARRQLTTEEKRQLIADQLRETPQRSNRWVAKMLGVSHPTVGCVRAEMGRTGKVYQFEKTVGRDGKYRQAGRLLPESDFEPLSGDGIAGHERPYRGASNDWLTPRYILAALGPFDLDPCAAPDPRPWPTAAKHFTEADNGLAHLWHGRM